MDLVYGLAGKNCMVRTFLEGVLYAQPLFEGCLMCGAELAQCCTVTDVCLGVVL